MVKVVGGGNDFGIKFCSLHLWAKKINFSHRWGRVQSGFLLKIYRYGSYRSPDTGSSLNKLRHLQETNVYCLIQKIYFEP
jgi:hypothetical protein